MRVHLRGAARAGRTSVCLLLTLLGVGCQGGIGSPSLTRVDPGELRKRARDLLLRAAQDDVDVVRANAIEALVRCAPRDGAPYFRAALQSEKPLVRFAACAAVGELQDRTALTGVQRLLGDPEPRVRLAAAFAAYRLGQRGRAAILVDTLNNHPDENLRSEAAYLIGKLGDPAARSRLLLAMRREKSGKALIHVHAALAHLGERDAIDALIRACVQSDPVAKLIALQTLAELPTPIATEALSFRLREDGDYLQTRLLAARGLGRLGNSDGYNLAARSITARGDDDNETVQIRSLAALALGAIRDQRALPLLERAADSENDPRLQVAACLAIMEITSR